MNDNMSDFSDWTSLSSAQKLDLSAMEQMFPGKPQSSLQSWLDILRTNGFDTIHDLEAIVDDSAMLAQLQLPLMVKARLKSAVTKAPTASLAPALVTATPNTSPPATGGGTSQIAAGPGGGGARRRIIQELADFTRNAPPGWDVHPNADDISVWKLTFKGQPNTPYEDVYFCMLANFPQDYPFKPMKCRFLSVPYHCNISSTGQLCLDMLEEKWAPALTMGIICVAITNLFSDPNPDDPLDAFKGYMCRDDRQAYNAAAKLDAAKNAFASLEALYAHFYIQPGTPQ